MRDLIVHIPDLEHLPDAGGGLPEPLHAVLGRAARVECRGDALSEALAGLIGMAEVPAPAVCSRLAVDRGTRPEDGSWWLRFDPLWMVPDLTAVWIDRPAALDLGADAGLVRELDAMFGADGLDWTPAAGRDHGVLALDGPPGATFQPLSACPGRRLDDLLPEGPGAARWRRLINESQMLFHQFRDSSRADQRGIGLWFWGAGSLPSAPASPRFEVIAGPASARIDGLARWQHADPMSVEDPAGALFGDGPPLLLHWPLDVADPGGGLDAFCAQWLTPGRRIRLAVVGSHGYWGWSRRARWRFRSRTPAGFIHQAES